MKDDRHAMLEPLMDLRTRAAARFEAGDPRAIDCEAIMSGGGGV
jgi:hypothetical protein